MVDGNTAQTYPGPEHLEKFIDYGNGVYAPIVWEPQSGSQSLFLACPFQEVLYEGTRGNGKTDALLMSFLQFVGQGFGPAWKGILFRLTYKQLEDVVSKTKRWFWQIFPDAKFNASEYKWTFPDGEELILSYMRTEDDYWNYHGHEYPWIGWEELTNWHDSSCYDRMKSCNRSSHPGMPRMYRATCNPWGIGHGWVKEYFIDKAPPLVPIVEEFKDDITGEITTRKRCYIHGDLRENLVLLKNDPDYLNTLKSISDDNLRKAWLYGSWDIVGGGIFSGVWNEAVHFIWPFNIPAAWHVDRSFDWGSSRPFSVGWYATSNGEAVTLKDGTQRSYPKGTKFRISEWYGCKPGKANEGLQMLAGDIAQGIKDREEAMRESGLIRGRVRPGPADSSIFDVEDGHSIANSMAKKGVSWLKADKSAGSRVNGWEKIRNMLAAAMEKGDDGRILGPKKGPMEEPGFFVFNTCSHWKRTVPTLPRDTKKLDDVDTDAEDHAGDETRYNLYRKRTTSSEEELSL